MSDAYECDRCKEFFKRTQSVRKYRFQRGYLNYKGTSPTVDYKGVDLCGNCYEDLVEWFEDDEEITDETMLSQEVNDPEGIKLEKYNDPDETGLRSGKGPALLSRLFGRY